MPQPLFYAFVDNNGTEVTVTVDALDIVLARHGRPQVGNFYRVTWAMIAEAVALDRKMECPTRSSI